MPLATVQANHYLRRKVQSLQIHCVHFKPPPAVDATCSAVFTIGEEQKHMVSPSVSARLICSSVADVMPECQSRLHMRFGDPSFRIGGAQDQSLPLANGALCPLPADSTVRGNDCSLPCLSQTVRRLLVSLSRLPCPTATPNDARAPRNLRVCDALLPGSTVWAPLLATRQARSFQAGGPRASRSLRVCGSQSVSHVSCGARVGVRLPHLCPRPHSSCTGDLVSSHARCSLLHIALFRCPIRRQIQTPN